MVADDGPSGSGQHHAPDAAEHDVLDLASAVIMTHEVRLSKSPYNRRIINSYEFDHRIGRGQHGEVWLARDTSRGGREVAIKVVKRKNPRQDRLSQLRKRKLPSQPHLPLTDQLGSTEHKIRKEIAIMKKCRHPHVVRLLEVIDDNLSEKIYMVMEYLQGGEIKWRTANDEPVLRVEQTRRICRDVILGLEYLHHQGIIHRDIKPANLLWSADRRTVKITDFGVSHFSYAQRLAAAGSGSIDPDDQDPILMDDSDLSKTAGTPMFLAPEIVTDTSVEASSSSSTLQLSAPRRKPAITKAIDVWAFGVTLYGLLFGHLPFSAANEFEIFQVIRRQDWDVDPYMGVDQIPTGGRHQKPQKKGEETEGYLVVNLLERLLEKDARKRITLDEVKRHPWILRDLQNPQQWLRETELKGSQSSLEVTADETSSAMSSVRFRWSGVANRITHFWRNVRPWSSSSTPREDETKNVGVRSAPSLVRHRTATGAPHRQASSRDREPLERDKGKQRQSRRMDVSRNKSTPDVSPHLLKNGSSFEPFEMWDKLGSSSSGQTHAPHMYKQRRGSFPSKMPGMTLEVPPKPLRLGSPQPSPASCSQASTPSGDSSTLEDRPRSRLSLSSWPWMRGWRKQAATPETGSSTPRRSRSIRGRGRLARRSEDAFNAAVPSRRSNSSGPITFAMRAASWGEVADYGRPSEDVTSLYSGDRGDELDDETLLLGAGGVAQSPIPSIPSGLLSTVSSMSSQSLGHSPPPTISAAYALLQRTDVGEPASAPDPAALDAARQSQIRPRASSPLAHSCKIVQPSIEQALSRHDSDTSSSYDHDSDSSILSYDDMELQPSTSQMYQDEDDEDEESEDEDQVRLEVRTRRPSTSRTGTGTGTGNGAVASDSSHRERPMICI
ncbi:kinase-like protein [Laetiporus sulphureus 93-53]|uniref:Kinase-like protein n=1 Tax=Laetiporus sulphureus 93-53 TaxID=1314785 RepID=A0A165BRQ7_9APHY|nr:kinase-like protein [Laetiporus sulphureus 93-53]KZT01532.1 kinase-like protein [Laetiporus sulphureus 93-53]